MGMFKWGKGLGSSKTNLGGGGLNRSPLNLKSKPKKYDKDLSDMDRAFYEAIWEEREHRCVMCGVRLPDELSPIYMDHLLPKRNYPQFRHEDDNIVVVCIECHTKRENGFPCPKHKYYIEQAEERFLG